MTFKALTRPLLPAAALTLLASGMAFAQEAQDAAVPATAPVPTINTGDTAWMMTSAVLVLLMTVPGLALFYGGLVRTKNMLSVLMQVLAVTALMMIAWTVYGYSLAFTSGGSLHAFIGGFDKLFLAGIKPDTLSGTIPEYVFVCFQMTFAAITPALAVGAFAERMKFSAVLLFALLWLTFVYLPIAHMVWGGAGALIFDWGALDFAGGTVVHINAGVAGLIGAILVGKRIGYGKEALPPHSMTLTMVGASLLWVGWFGFNAGSALAANGTAALAMVNTFTATAAAILSWSVVEAIFHGKPSMLGAASGAVAGLVAVTPAAGFIGPIGAIVLGIIVSPVCFFFVTSVKNGLGYDDSLDVFGVHGIGGIIGAIGTGILVSPALGGTGVADYAMGHQVFVQIKAVVVTLLWTGIGSFIIFKVIDLIVGLRVPVEAEREGLDITSHGESAYHY